MSNLQFDREKSNLGGINGLKFIYEKELLRKIDIVKGRVYELVSYSEFIVPDIVLESSTFKEDPKGLNLFEYEYTGFVARDDYEKLLDCISLDNSKIIAVVKDNNMVSRLLGNKSNGCLARLTFNKGKRVADLNAYQLTIIWKSAHRAAFITDMDLFTAYQFQDGELFHFQDGELFGFND